jgi:hypothetical protein
MVNIADILLEEGLSKAESLGDRLFVVAKSVGRCVDLIPDGILYEVEITRALAELRKKQVGFLTETDVKNLSKPARNHNYQQFGVISISLRDAIAHTLQEMNPTRPFEVRYQSNDLETSYQQFSFRVLFYKEDEKLKQYILSRASIYPKIVYAFAVPDTITTIRDGARQN